jgi:hypothetical protein
MIEYKKYEDWLYGIVGRPGNPGEPGANIII